MTGIEQHHLDTRRHPVLGLAMCACGGTRPCEPARRQGNPSVSSAFLSDVVLLTCELTVNGERIQVHQRVHAEVWNQPDAAEHAMNALRQALIDKLIETHPPKVTVRR